MPVLYIYIRKPRLRTGPACFRRSHSLFAHCVLHSLSVHCTTWILAPPLMLAPAHTQALENRTKESRQEMDILDALEEIKDANSRIENGTLSCVCNVGGCMPLFCGAG
jgi:hypothetical protein